MQRPDFRASFTLERRAGEYSGAVVLEATGERIEATPGHTSGEACLRGLFYALVERVAPGMILPGDVP